jgi:hypothetical protein
LALVEKQPKELNPHSPTFNGDPCPATRAIFKERIAQIELEQWEIIDRYRNEEE